MHTCAWFFVGMGTLWVRYRNTIGTIAAPYTEAKGEQKNNRRGAKPIGLLLQFTDLFCYSMFYFFPVDVCQHFGHCLLFGVVEVC